MYKTLCRVVGQTEPVSVQTKNGELMKCYIRLKEIGGDFANEFNAAVLGNLAQVNFLKDELVSACLRFRVNEREGNIYQDITATEIIRMKG